VLGYSLGGEGPSWKNYRHFIKRVQHRGPACSWKKKTGKTPFGNRRKLLLRWDDKVQERSWGGVSLMKYSIRGVGNGNLVSLDFCPVNFS